MFPNQQKNFILQQGFDEPAGTSCPLQYKALLFQPWVVGSVAVAGTLLRSRLVFGILAAALFWSALLPPLNPFDAVYNSLFGNRPNAPRLALAPSPRRFAQLLAGTFSLFLALSLHFQWRLAFWILDGFFLTAILALVSGGFCFGSLVFHTLTGKFAFAKRTLPWAQ